MEGGGESWLACPKIHVDLIFIYIDCGWLCWSGPQKGSGSCPGRIDYFEEKFIYLFCSFCLACLDVFRGGGRVLGWFLFLIWYRDPNFSFI